MAKEEVKTQEEKYVNIKNISLYEVVISEVPGGLAIKKGETKKLSTEYIEIVTKTYSKFVRILGE